MLLIKNLILNLFIYIIKYGMGGVVMKINIKPLSKVMGAEIIGINLKDNLDEAIKKSFVRP